jgi:hypothetical protein
MGAHVELGERILEWLAAINATRPVVDTAKAEAHLLGYLAGLGLEPTGVRWLPDLYSLNRERQRPRYEVGTWRSYMGRHHALFQPLLDGSARRQRRRVGTLARLDRVVLLAGLGLSQQMTSVRRLVPLLLPPCSTQLSNRPRGRCLDVRDRAPKRLRGGG